MPVLDPDLPARADALARSFADAQPFRWVDIPAFLEAGACAELLAEFPDFEARHALNEMGQVGGKAVRMDVRDIGPGYRRFDALIQSRSFLDLVSRITGIPDLLFDPDYIGGGTHENRDGQGLDAHVDFNYHPRTRWHRRLNLIVYLNPQWDEAWGGALELHSDPWNEAADAIVSIAPTFNRCVIFETTESSWHGFAQIRLPEEQRALSRKSFAIYLYTRERPRAETAAPHATIYVPESMPLQWQAGRTLDGSDLGTLRSRFARLRTQLRHLYDREKQFGAQIRALEDALAETRAALRLPLQGYATQPRGSEGIWPDGWIGAQASAVFVPTRAVRELELQLWAPPQLGAQQELEITVGARSDRHRLRTGQLTTLRWRIDAAVGEECVLRITAARTWTPSATGESADERALACRIVAASLIH